MVTAQIDPSAIEPDETLDEQRHFHRPFTWSEPYHEFGIEYRTPYCVCGIELTRRPARSVRPVPAAS